MDLAVKYLGADGADDEPAEGRRAQVVMACGLGKTTVGGVVSCAVAAEGRVLVLVPTVLLLTQTLAEYRRAVGEAAVGRVLVVCSRQQAAASGRAAREDLEQQRVLVTTDPQVISAVAAAVGRVTVLATYASQHALVRAHREHRLGPWDLAIADEAHRTAGAAGRPWGRVHDQALLPARRRLYMTATPRLATGSCTASGEEVELVGMDDERVFGPVAFRMGFAAGIELGLLARWRLVIATVSDADVRAATALDADEQGLVQVGQAAIPARMLAVQIALLRTAAEFGVRRALSYHSRVATARAFAATLPLAAELLPAEDRPARVWARDLHGQHTAAQRDIRLRALAEGLDDGLCVLSNARLLSEGVDVPAVDGVLFSDPRASAVDIVQAIGRALRRGDDPGKVATIIVPLLTDPAAGADPDQSKYRPVWRVVQALRAHDETLATELDAQRRRLGDPSETETDVWAPQWLHIRGAALPEQFSEAVTIRLVQAATPSWEEFYGAAQAYHAQHGHLRIPQDYKTPAGLPLGRWIATQRQHHSRGLLSQDRLTRLQALGMIWDALQWSWIRGITAARAYRQRHGHLNVPQHARFDGFGLGMWLVGQRERYRSGVLEADRRQALEDLGIDWEPGTSSWRRGLAVAQAYHAEHGHLDVSHNDPYQGFPLGRWLTARRSEHRKGTLAPERITALNELGIIWEPSDWHRGLAAARAFHAQHGHLRVPHGHLLQGVALGQWLTMRRVERRRGTLDPGRIAALDELGIDWDPSDTAWRQGLAAARAYRDQHGHLNVPQRLRVDDIPLGLWVSRQRALHRKGRLPTDRIKALEALGIDWDPNETAWKRGLAAARAFHAQHGHLDVPRDHCTPDGFKLGAWIRNKRQRRRVGSLPQERITELEALGMIWTVR